MLCMRIVLRFCAETTSVVASYILESGGVCCRLLCVCAARFEQSALVYRYSLRRLPGLKLFGVPQLISNNYVTQEALRKESFTHLFTNQTIELSSSLET